MYDDADVEFRELVLQDLDEIKDSVSEEEEFYDKKYQKEVLSEIKDLKKSVQDLANSYLVTLDSSLSNTVVAGFDDTGKTVTLTNRNGATIYRFDISNIDKFYVDLSNYSGSAAWLYIIMTSSNKTSGSFSAEFGYYYSLPLDEPIKCINYTNSRFLLLSVNDPLSLSDVNVYYYKSENPNAPDHGTIQQIDYSEPLDTLIQISTFQGFASALLTGILLFLIFIKGLRR